MAVLALALVIDVMKPASLGFVTPGTSICGAMPADATQAAIGRSGSACTRGAVPLVRAERPEPHGLIRSGIGNTAVAAVDLLYGTS